MSKVISHYLTLLSPTALVAAIAATEFTFESAKSLQEPVSVLKYLTKTKDAKAVVKSSSDLVDSIIEQIKVNLEENELTKNETKDFLDAVAEQAIAIADAEAAEKAAKPKVKRTRKAKADVSADPADEAN